MKLLKTLFTASSLAVCAAATAGGGGGVNVGSGVAPADAGVNSLQANSGNTLCTAAVNSDGTVAGNFRVNTASTTHITTGQYGVVFSASSICTKVTAANGWMRFVQADTFTTGSVFAHYCTTADLAGNVNGVFVHCFDGTGTPSDVSFFLMVTR